MKGTLYAADLSECCEASFDGCSDVVLYRGVSIDAYAQNTYGTIRQHRGRTVANCYPSSRPRITFFTLHMARNKFRFYCIVLYRCCLYR